MLTQKLLNQFASIFGSVMEIDFYNFSKLGGFIQTGKGLNRVTQFIEMINQLEQINHYKIYKNCPMQVSILKNS